MDYADILNVFFSRKREAELNELMMSNGCKEAEKDIKDYVNEICAIPIDSMIDYICCSCPDYMITSKDVYQFSNFEDATRGVCSVLLKRDNKGLRYKEIGEELQSDGKERTDFAKAKYGENHFKMAEDLGLGFRMGRYDCYLSAIGYLFVEMDEEYQRHLITRLILRSKLIIRLYREAKKGEVQLETLLYDLAESTYTRRKSNIRTVIEELQKTSEHDFTYFANKIIY